MNPRPLYKNPQQGQPLLTTISSNCKTPLLEVKFCNLIKPFYYPNSSVARYSITCFVDPDDHREFLKDVQTIEKNEGVETIIKNDHTKSEDQGSVLTGKFTLKFQTTELVPVYAVHEGKEPLLMALEDELARGENVEVLYDIRRYTKKNTAQTEHGITFRPTAIYYYPRG